MIRRFGVLFLLTCLSTSCNETPVDESPARGMPDPSSVLDVVVGPRTTDGSIAEHNLTAQIRGLRDAAERGFAGPEIEDALVNALLVRAQFFGTWSDFDEALRRSESRTADEPASASAFELHAKVLSAVHRFEPARAVLHAAPPSPAIDAAMLSVDEATGGARDHLLQARQRSTEQEGRTFANLTALARALAQVGRFDEADAVYVEAAKSYADVSPFPIAWIAFSRGLMWGEIAGRPDLARPQYEEAVRRLPGYVVANVHLAELEADAGETQRAGARLEHLARETLLDPEPDAVLGRISGDASVTHRALLGYERALLRYPEAVWDHAAEFFLADGDSPGRADELATLNLELRPTERAYLLAIRAALAAKDRNRADEIAASVERPIHTTGLRELIAELP